jgi:LuxR family transcriptional regulator, maltose regulon positive regulatory protein
VRPAYRAGVTRKSQTTRRLSTWLSLDEGDNDPSRFLLHLVAALQAIAAEVGAGVAAALQSSQPPPIDTMLTVLLNDITALPDPFILVLDDYHLIEAHAVDDAVTFLLEHLPPQMRSLPRLTRCNL